MEGNTPPTQGEPASSRTPVGSPSSVRYSEDIGDHEDMPLKKRPKLDDYGREMARKRTPPPGSDDIILMAEDGSYTNEGVTCTTPQQTPSKVTLNLRSPTSSESTLPADVESNPDAADGQTLHFMPHQPPGRRDSDEVVEIRLDDPDNQIGQTTQPDDLDGDEAALSLAADLLQSFPPVARSYGDHSEKANAWISEAAHDKVDLDLLMQVSDWIRGTWLANSIRLLPVRYVLFLQEKPFWDKVADIYRRLLVNRSLKSINATPSRHNEPLTSFLLPYMELCAEFIAADIGTLQETKPSDSVSQDLVSAKHLTSLSALLRPWQNTPLWGFLDANTRVNPELSQRQLAVRLVEACPALVKNLATFVRTTFRNPSLASKQGEQLVQAFGVLRFLHTHISCQTTAWQKTRAHEQLACNGPAFQDASLVIQETALDMGRLLHSGTAAKQLPSLSLEQFRKLQLHTGELASDVALTDAGQASKFLPSFGTLPLELQDFLPTCVYHCVLLNEAWHLVIKARMEVKVANLHQLSSEMVALYKAIEGMDRRHPHAPRHIAYDFVSGWITKMRVVEYLSSAESHPQLLSRSSDMFSFLFVTDAWKEDLTHAVWSTILENPDPRMCATMWEALRPCVRYFTPSVLSSFCQKTQMLSPTSLSPEMISFYGEFFSQVMYNKIITGEYVLGLQLANPLVSVKHLICLSASRPDASRDANVSITLHSQALHWLTRIAEAARSEDLRKTIYQECVADLKAGSINALGSLEAAYALLSATALGDSALAADTGMLDAVVDELCTFVTSSLDSTPDNDVPFGMKSRLSLLTKLMVDQAGRSVTSARMQVLFQHLFGHDACNNASKDMCWEAVAILARSSKVANHFMDYLIDVFLPDLAIDAYCVGLVGFLRTSVGYKRSVTAAPAPSDDEIIEIPLIDVFWKAALLAPYHQLRQHAAKAITDLYLDDNYIKSAPRSCIVATHHALIERCTAELNTAVSSHVGLYEPPTRTPLDASISDQTALSPATPSDPLLRISSILFFLGTFVMESRRHTWLREITSPIISEPSSPVNEVEGEAVELKYQIVGTAAGNPKIRSLRLPKNASYADLCEVLKQKTGLQKLWLIHGGATLDVTDKMQQPILPLVDRGLLLVRKDVRHNPATLAQAGLIATDRAIMNHLDTLYDLLDVQPPVNHEIGTFLKHFPPHEQVRRTVLQSNVSPEMLFPLENPAKTSYTAMCLRKFLTEQTSRNAVDELFVKSTVGLLAKAVTGPQPSNAHDPLSFKQQWGAMSELVETLLVFLRERPQEEELGQCLEASGELAWSLCSMIDWHISSSQPFDNVAVYACLLEAAMHSRTIWETFRRLPNLPFIHQWLLCDMDTLQRRESVKDLICNTCSLSSSPAGISLSEIASFYWQGLSPLVPAVAAAPLRSIELLHVLGSIFSSNSTALMDEAALRNLQASWTLVLARHQHIERPGEAGIDGFVKGMLKLLKHCVSALKSYKKPISNNQLLHTLLTKYLFPPLNLVSQGSDPLAVSAPILDPENRKIACELMLAACDNTEAYHWLIQQLSGLTEMETGGPFYDWGRDRTQMLRTPGGFSGLRNLSNTCYMNSLTAQLFMNESFRKFLLGTKTDQGKQRNLLQATQKLFAQMQNSQDKYADTLGFAKAIRPYDGDQIDVSVQMDVDEFFMLLFDRWEGEMASPQAKDSFRRFYGGELITQTKSKDCEHVSERVDYLSTIQCEVKGKQGLEDSLRAYIEGDVMEGDNKYKCESCGGRFVNAVKRSCLKVLPDNLIFSLKRFEFDMTTLTRYKVNDEFTFPWTIDMTPYTIDYVNDPSAASEPDVFQLVGVVEHMGTAEAGHYISFIRTPPSASSTGETWARFDDMEVSEFEKEKLAEQCFGGTMPDNPQYNKWYNAYMLFYKRVPAVQAEDEANRAKSQAGPAQHPVPDSLGNEILATNQTLLREYCLLDPSLVMLIKGVTSDMRHKSNGQCSPDHRIERDMLEMILQQLYMVFSHGKDGKDFDAIARHLMKQADGCAMCHSILLDWITDNPSCTETLLLSCPVPLIRVAWAHLVYRLLESHRNLDPEGYGYGAEMSGSDESASDGGYPLSETSSLQRTVLMLKDLLRSLGQRQIKLWDSFFELWCLVADLGPIEKAVMLGEGLFTEALRILQMQPKVLPLNGQYVGLMDLGPVCSRWISSKRQFPATNLIRFIATIFEVVDICAEIVPDRGSRIPDIQLERFPITEPEAILIFDDFKKFLINMAERWDNANTSPLWPAEIVTQLTSCATEIETVDNVADTELATGRQIKADIKATIPEFFKPWFLHSFRTPIRMTEAFCLECSSPQEVQRVVADLADLLHRELTEEVGAPPMTAFNVLLDYDGDGAAAVLDFFDRMARNAILQKYSGAPEDCEELLKLVINTLPSWAPGLLVFSPKNVREASDRFLDSILFNNFPEAVSSALDVDELDEYDDALTSLDNARITTVRRLYEQCAIVVSVARKLTLPKRFVTNIDRVMGYCASWCEKILDDQSGIFLSMNANTAFDQRIRNDYQARVCRAIQDWDNEIEIDPMASDTEYDSDGSDPENFEVEVVS